MTSGALARFTVIDLTRVRAGPTCVRQFADMGAHVIKVENPGVGDGGLGGARNGPDFQNLHRNKRAITLDLKAPEGLAILKQLVASADVVVENFRPDVKDRLGINYADLRAINTRIVYASISGFGEDGPYRMRPGFDQIAQGMGGLMSVTGLPGQGPVRAGIPLADLCSGLFAAQGVMAALLERESSGEGQWVQVSLLASQVAMMDFQAARYLMKGEVPGQAGNDHPTNIPTGVFATVDGHVNIAAADNLMFSRLCKALGIEHAIKDPLYITDVARSANRVALNALIQAVMVTDTSESWIERLAKGQVPCGKINTMDQVFADPQVQHLGMARTIQHAELGPIQVVNQAIKLSRTPPNPHTAIGPMGEANEEVLGGLGYSAAQIEELRAKGVI